LSSRSLRCWSPFSFMSWKITLIKKRMQEIPVN
jgi:hypothetical protein